MAENMALGKEAGAARNSAGRRRLAVAGGRLQGSIAVVAGRVREIAFACAVALCLACAVVLAGCGAAGSGVSGSEDGIQDHSPKAGDALSFGTFEQDNNFADGSEPIAWIVLEVDEATGRMLIITEQSIYTMRFNSSIDQGNDWETSELRSWLTGEFVNAAFTAEERARMDGELFLLSVDEARTYFATDEARVCHPTDYARSLDAFVAGGPGCAWWLRTPGKQWYTVARVLPDGSIWDYGDEVVGNCGGVRPAAWVLL